jgi:DNA-binding transcriptional MerR regulator
LFKINDIQLNSIKETYTIKDFENLSGIKAHTIRIWEKRYNLFSPERLASNFRSYTQEDLRKMLNIAYLNINGFKISKIAALSNNDIEIKVREHSTNNQNNDAEINSLKLAMLKFDTVHFNQVYLKLLSEKNFSQVIESVFIPLLVDIGILWHSNTINPAHEHFISNLIIQKIQIQTEKSYSNQAELNNDFVHVLFLPTNEIHEIGLLYINYLLTLKGQKTVYLGQSIPLKDLRLIQQQFTNVKFITNFTTEPKTENTNKYFSELLEIFESSDNHCSIIGNKTKNIKTQSIHISLFQNISEYITQM